MCGIGGIVLKEPSYINDSLKKISQSMFRRGKDDQGFYLFNGIKQSIYYGNATSKESILYHNLKSIDSCLLQSNIGFTHRRLSIIDLSPKGFQPMSFEHLTIVFNGEIYNFKDIRDELKSFGYSFKTESDTEVLLLAYHKWGKKVFPKLNGMYAFAIHDRKNREIVLAKDRFGIKPLFYSYDGNRFVFGSDIKAVLSSGMVEREINHDQMRVNFAISACSGKDTLLSRIKNLSEGNYLSLDLDSFTISKTTYYTLPKYCENLKDQNFTIDKIEEILFDSTKLRLVSDVSNGVFLSGGIDSSLVTGIASIHTPGIKAFTLGFNGIDCDESFEAAANAKMFNVKHIIKKVSPIDLTKDIFDVVSAFEEPYPSLSPSFILARSLKEEGIKVSLSGLGGDELFFGYNYHSKYRFKRLLEYLPKWKIPTVGKFLKQVEKYSNIGDLEYYFYVKTIFNDEIINKIFRENRTTFSVFKKSYNSIEDGKGLKTIQDLDMKWYLARHQFYRDDQFLMYHGIEGRFPFLDHRMVELSYNISHDLKMKNRKLKYLLKTLARKYLSKESLSMKKKGFILPLEKLFNSELYEFSFDQLSDLKKRGVVNNIVIDTKIAEKKVDTLVWQLVTLEIWYKLFIDSFKE